MSFKFSFRSVQISDLEKVGQLPQNKEELFFMFPKAEYSLSVEQLEAVVVNRSDSTVILLDNEIVDFVNFYEVKTNESSSIGNVIVSSDFLNKVIRKYLIETMESIALEKYNVREYISLVST